MALNTFDPKDLEILVAGHKIRGYAETQVAISRPDAMWNSQVGATGDTMRVKTNNRTTDVVLTLQQSSPSIDVLSDIASEDYDNNDGVFSIKISYSGFISVPGEEPLRPQTLLSAENCYIEKKPDATWGNTPQDREFTIKCPDATYDLGATTNKSTGKTSLEALGVQDPGN